MEHNAIRYGDEYQCSTCGKAWSVDDTMPDCTIDTRLIVEPKTGHNKLIAELNANIRGLKMLLHVDPQSDRKPPVKK